MTKEQAKKIIDDWYTGGGFKFTFLKAVQAADREYLRQLVIGLSDTVFAPLLQAICTQREIKLVFKIFRGKEDQSSTWAFVWDDEK